MATAKKPATLFEMVAIGSIDRSPYQPRQVFDETKLAELAATIKTHGLLQKPLVRAKGKRFELIAGERRLRAAKIAGLKRIPVEVVAADDNEAAEMTAIENLQRTDLSAIEEALAFQTLLNGPGEVRTDGKLTETELAKRLGVSQGHISNRLRLLGLPEFVQKKVISHEIPATHARALVSWKDYPAVLKNALERYKEGGAKYGDGLPSLEQFETAEIYDAVEHAGRTIVGQRYDGKSGRHFKHFTPTAEQREALDIRSVANPWLSQKRVEIAMNTVLWDKLQAEHESALAVKKNGKPAAAKKNGQPKAKKLTAAQQKAAAAEEARKAKERAAQFTRRLYGWWINWQRWLLAEWVREGCGVDDLLRLALLLDVEWPRGYQFDRAGRLASLLDAHGLKPKTREFVKPMFALDPDEVSDVAKGFLASLFWAGDAPNEQIVPADDVVALVKIFEIDLENAWLADQAGPMSEPFWNLHNKNQLVALAKEAGVEVEAGGKKADLVAAMLAKRPKDSDLECGIDMPKELKKGLKQPAGFTG